MEWSTVDEWSTWPYDPYYPYFEEKNAPPVPAQHVSTQAQEYHPDQTFTLLLAPPDSMPPPDMPPKGENPREIRNKAEKQRRDKMKKSIAELAKIVPPVVATGRKMDKTNVLKLTAHYLRAHQYVFGDSINSGHQFSAGSTHALIGLLKGFVLTTTYKGIVVVVSQNVQRYLGYTELELLGKSIFDYTHADDREMLREQLMPSSNLLGANGELLIPDGPDGTEKVADALAREKRRFVVRFKKIGQRPETSQYLTCHVQGTLRKADKASRNSSRCCQMVRRVRARGDTARPCGNDVVFVGLVRPTTETFMNESGMESFRMEYRTRHSIDGEIIECESRIALVTGYMTHEVNGVNAMNFMHRDDVRWVIIALREMYDQHRLVGESCYRLMTKNRKFIYMQTRGFLDVDRDSRAVTSFVCTNTVVEENVGKRLIKLMKKKFTLLVNNGEETDIPDDNEDEDTKELADDQLSPIPVEDPRQLQKVILHLVTNLPSPQPIDTDVANSPSQEDSFPQRLAIIPPRKERIVSAIEKIYSVIKPFHKDPVLAMDPNKKGEYTNQDKNARDDSDTEAGPSTEDQQPQDLRTTPADRPYDPASPLLSDHWGRRKTRIVARNHELEPMTKESTQCARTDRLYVKPSISKTRCQSRRESYPESSQARDDSHSGAANNYPQSNITSASHFAPIDAPSSSRGISFAGSSHHNFGTGIKNAKCGIVRPQRRPEPIKWKHESQNPNTPPVYNSSQILRRTLSDEMNNNFAFPDPDYRHLMYTELSSMNVNPSTSLYVPYQTDDFGGVFPSPNHMPRHQNYRKPHTQTSETMATGYGTKRQNDFLTPDESINKRIAQGAPMPQFIYPNALPASYPMEQMPFAATTATETLSVEVGPMSIAAPIEAVTTCYANATLSTAGVTFSFATVQEPVPLFTAEESNMVREQANERGNVSSSDQIIVDSPEEIKDEDKIQIEDLMIDGNCLESNHPLGEDSLEHTLGEDFPDLRVLAECEKLEKADCAECPGTVKK